MNVLLGSVVLSALVSGIITYLANKLISERNHEVEYVTQERQSWRKDIKDKTSLFCSICSNTKINIREEKKIKELQTFLSLSLNPGNNCGNTEDEKIVDLLNEILRDTINKNNENIKEESIKEESIKEENIKKENIKELEILVSFLLKHDWERVKKDMGMAYKEVDRANRYIGEEIPKKNFFQKLMS